jgi:hypothetical protein
MVETMEYGFLHIGKTGGSSVNKLINTVNKRRSAKLLRFGHKATLDSILSSNQTRISFVIRDPIDRFVSGFESRLRCGRPTYNFKWTDAEAISFSFFGTVNELAESLECDNERLVSAAQYAVRAISHLRRDYSYHLHSVDFLDKHSDRIYFVCDIRELNEQVHNIVAPSGLPEQKAKLLFQHLHAAPSKGRRPDLSEKAVHNLKKFLEADYLIYEFCKANLCRLNI